MEFTFFKDDLLNGLQLLEPFVGHSFEEYIENHTTTILLPKHYYEDKIVFRFEDNKCYMSVSREDLDVEINIPNHFKIGSFTFCVTFWQLLLCLEAYDTELIRFEEERFFGFSAYAVELHPKKYLFDIEAYSTKWLKKFVTNPIHGKDTVMMWIKPILEMLGKYTDTDYITDESFNYIWIKISNGISTAFASNRYTFACIKEEVSMLQDFQFAILGKYSNAILGILQESDGELKMLKEGLCARILSHGAGIVGRMSVTYSIPEIGDDYKNIASELINAKSISFMADIFKDNLLKIANKISEIKSCKTKIILHFF